MDPKKNLNTVIIIIVAMFILFIILWEVIPIILPNSNNNNDIFNFSQPNISAKTTNIPSVIATITNKNNISNDEDDNNKLNITDHKIDSIPSNFHFNHSNINNSHTNDDEDDNG